MRIVASARLASRQGGARTAPGALSVVGSNRRLVRGPRLTEQLGGPIEVGRSEVNLGQVGHQDRDGGMVVLVRGAGCCDRVGVVALGIFESPRLQRRPAQEAPRDRRVRVAGTKTLADLDRPAKTLVCALGLTEREFGGTQIIECHRNPNGLRVLRGLKHCEGAPVVSESRLEIIASIGTRTQVPQHQRDRRRIISMSELGQPKSLVEVLVCRLGSAGLQLEQTHVSLQSAFDCWLGVESGQGSFGVSSPLSTVLG